MHLSLSIYIFETQIKFQSIPQIGENKLQWVLRISEKTPGIQSYIIRPFKLPFTTKTYFKMIFHFYRLNCCKAHIFKLLRKYHYCIFKYVLKNLYHNFHLIILRT